MSDAFNIEECDQRTDAGFTLFELLVAIGLLSLLSVILLSNLHFGLQAWQRGTGHADRVGQVVLVQNFLRRALEDVYPFFTGGTATQGRVEFEGTAGSLRLLFPTPHALASAGRSRLSFAVDQRRQGLDLVVTVTPELAMDARDAPKKILLADIQSVELSYFGKGRSDQQGAWRDQWTGEPSLPQLVRIQVSFLPGDNRTWPEFVVAPRIGADVGCVYDPLTKRCRGR